MRKRFYIGQTYKIKARISVEFAQDILMILGRSMEDICDDNKVSISSDIVSEANFSVYRIIEGTPAAIRKISELVPFTMTRI